MDSRAKELITVGASLFAKKRPYDELCQEIAENFFPLRADFTSPFTLGHDFSEGLMESFPVQARETLGNTIGALLRQGEWFSAKTGSEETDEDPANARWLESATDRFRRLVYDRRANFVRATGEADHDYVTFGNPVLSVEESPTRDHFLFRNWHIRDCAWMENSVGKIDHLHRRMSMTARMMVRKWPKTVRHEIEEAAKKDPTREFKISHIVLPLDEIYGDDKAKRRQYKDMPFVSLYIDCEDDKFLSEGGLPVFNYVIPRWRTVSGWPYGFSPATLTGLPDGRMIQMMSRILLEQGEKAVDPPMYGKGEIFRDAVNRYAGGMTYVDMEMDQSIRDAMMFEDPSRGLAIGLDMKQDVRQLLAESFLLNRLSLPPQGKTAFETQALLDQYRRAILPFTGPIESEYHLPLLDTAFQMAVRNRQFNFAEMPEALHDADVTFTFESPLNTAEGRQNVMAFQESVQILAGAAQFDKTIPTTIDFKKMTKDAVKGTGAPADWFADEEVQQSDEEAQVQTDNLVKAAEFLKGGAGVVNEVAGASIAAQAAGLAA
jgi:hypothetical protein